MTLMKVENGNNTDDRPEGNETAAQSYAAPEPHGETGFAAQLQARYERVSLLTLDLAEEAGEAAVSFSQVEKGDKTGRFERRIAAMTRAIWAHRVIERLRTGGSRTTHRRADAIRQYSAGGMPQQGGLHPLYEDLFVARVADKNVSRETQGEKDCVHTICEGKSPAKVQSDGRADATTELQAAESETPAYDPEYDPGYEIVYDGPAAGPGAGFDEAAFDGAEIFDEGEIDEAALDAAIKKALREGKRGEQALRAALGVDNERKSVRAPP